MLNRFFRHVLPNTADKYKNYLETEIGRGFRSPFVMLAYMGLAGCGGYLLITWIVVPISKQSSHRVTSLRVPYEESHNKFFGVKSKESNELIPASIMADPSFINRPEIIVREHSEAHPNTDLIVMEVREYDPKYKDDVYYRSLHYINAKGQSPAVANGDVIQGLIKCKALTQSNNCIIDQHDVPQETDRKMCLGIGMYYMLKNPALQYIPLRFVDQGEQRTTALLLGLGSGTLATLIQRQFTYLDVDVVEHDATVVKLARRYFGFKENPSSVLHLEEASEFIRKSNLKKREKYDLVMMDCLDEHGNVPPNLSRLEFLVALRDSMSPNGCVVATLPSKDPRVMSAIVSNWRLAFDQRTVVLMHCTTMPYSVLMTFKETTGRGMPKFQEAASIEDFKDIMRAFHDKHPRTMPFDLISEVDEVSWQQLLPGRKYIFQKRSNAAAQKK